MEKITFKDNEYVQLAIDLFVYADWDLSDLYVFYERGLLNNEEWNFVKEHIEIINNIRLKQDETGEDDLQILEKAFPELKNDSQFKESLLENYKQWQEEKDKLEKFMNEKLVEIASLPTIEKDFLLDEWKQRIAKCDYNIWRIRKLLKELGDIQDEEPKIPTKELFDKISRLGIDSVIEFYIQKKIPRGKTVHILCPLHNEKNPSFTIFRATNSFYCFGCNRGGGPIQFVQYFFDLNFYEAVQKLKEDFNIK